MQHLALGLIPAFKPLSTMLPTIIAKKVYGTGLEIQPYVEGFELDDVKSLLYVIIKGHW
jgi:hypothetical protein